VRRDDSVANTGRTTKAEPSMSDPRLKSWPDMPLAAVIGAGGMGLAIARRLGQHHRVLLADLDGPRLESLTATLRSEGLNILPVVCDVTRAASVADLAREISGSGPLRVLAHVVGLSPSMADWRRIMTVNLIGPTLTSEALLPLAGAGTAAVFIGSLAGHIGIFDAAVLKTLAHPLAPTFLDDLVAALHEEPSTTTSYMLSKLALMRMCQRQAPAWGRRGARIVSLSPGLIATPMGALEFEHQPRKFDLLAQTPLGRQGNMSEIADAVEFLASDKATFITGTDLLVDGGIHAALQPAP
jgi:NAD(P)-dependent dehydrogenase (short-subunit alcohol dehydrogenase family)